MSTIYRKFTPSQKEQIRERSKNAKGQICCEGCGLVLGAKPHEIDHVLAEKLRPDADKKQPLKLVEGQLLGVDCCHRGPDGKTKRDVSMIAKAKRMERKHFEGRKPSSFKSKGFTPAPPQNTATRPLEKTARRFL
ncbi:MAG: hypothetical protein ACE37E_01035 [Hyphomicrobiales bacterium]